MADLKYRMQHTHGYTVIYKSKQKQTILHSLCQMIVICYSIMFNIIAYAKVVHLADNHKERTILIKANSHSTQKKFK